LSQTVETVTRSSRIDIVGAGVDEIDPPEDIDEFAEQAKTNAIARPNLRKFVHDVWEPGYRVEGPDETVAFFEGEKDELDATPPEFTPEGGFLNNSAVLGGERYQDFYDFGKECSWQRWARGTVLVEYLKQDPDDPESMISGFNFIRPETVYPQVQNNTNILLEPDFDDLPDDVARKDVTFTRRDEVAAYIQFDDESILGLRNNGFSEQDVPLSQNDVLKQTLEPDIGGDIQKGEGVFGTSALEPVSEDIAEYEQMKSDRAEAIQRKAYGIWTAQFTPETIDLGDNGVEIIEWRDDAISDTEGELNQMGPGDVLTTDAGIDLERHDGDVPDLDPVLMHYVKTISSALPTPLPLAVDFAGDINRDVTGDQKDGFEQTVSEARKYQETSWTQALKFIAERAGLPTEGLQLKIQPEREENPVKSLTDEEVNRMNTYISTLATAAGPQAGPTALVDREAILEVMDFPEDEMAGENPEEIAEQMSDEETEAAWRDVMLPADGDDAEALSGEDIDRIADNVVEALDFQPELHPRDSEGKFAEKPGSGVGGGLDAVRDAYTSISKSIEVGGESVDASPVLRDALSTDTTELKEAALDELDDSFITESSYGPDSHGAKSEFNAWREEQDYSLLNDGSAELWGAAIDRTGNENVPDDAAADPLTYDDPLPVDTGDEPTTAIGDSVQVTRDTLRKMFGDTVPVTRGVHGGFAEQLREAKENGEPVELEHRALESWTTFPDHAQRFANEGDGDGVFITAEIPVDRIYGASHTTPGLTEEENEIVAALDSQVTYDPEQITVSNDDGMAEVYEKMNQSA